MALDNQYSGYDPRGTKIACVSKSMWSGDRGIFINACAMMYNHSKKLGNVLGLGSEPIRDTVQDRTKLDTANRSGCVRSANISKDR